ncbi:MAG: hypothetical protein IKO61_11015 [Lachnospiraceae bacterium]|nr:hypothetical protein [Lachnospiraceae bacterium]
MADKKDKKEKKEGVGFAGFLIVVLIITTWLSVMALLIKLDVGGFGSGALRPILKDVPVINKILPDATDEETARESDYPYTNLADALQQIKKLDAALGSKDAEIGALNDKVAELEKEVARLKTFEQQQEEFEQEKNKFYDEIIYGESAPSADTYIEWYNSIDAEKAEEIYRDMITSRQADEDIKKLAKSYETMDAKKAAAILATMSNDLDTVALIMSQLSDAAKGKILAEMEADYAALVTKKLMQ